MQIIHGLCFFNCFFFINNKITTIGYGPRMSGSRRVVKWTASTGGHQSPKAEAPPVPELNGDFSLVQFDLKPQSSSCLSHHESKPAPASCVPLGEDVLRWGFPSSHGTNLTPRGALHHRWDVRAISNPTGIWLCTGSALSPDARLGGSKECRPLRPKTSSEGIDPRRSR